MWHNSVERTQPAQPVLCDPRMSKKQPEQWRPNRQTTDLVILGKQKAGSPETNGKWSRHGHEESTGCGPRGHARNTELAPTMGYRGRLVKEVPPAARSV